MNKTENIIKYWNERSEREYYTWLKISVKKYEKNISKCSAEYSYTSDGPIAFNDENAGQDSSGRT